MLFLFKGLWSLIRLISYILPKYKFLNLPRDVIRSTARFRLCIHTLRIETATWNQSNIPTGDLCEADDIRPHPAARRIAPHSPGYHKGTLSASTSSMEAPMGE